MKNKGYIFPKILDNCQGFQAMRQWTIKIFAPILFNEKFGHCFIVQPNQDLIKYLGFKANEL